MESVQQVINLLAAMGVVMIALEFAGCVKRAIDRHNAEKRREQERIKRFRNHRNERKE